MVLAVLPGVPREREIPLCAAGGLAVRLCLSGDAVIAAPILSEAQLHKAVAQYLDAVLYPNVVWTSIGHGGGGKIRGSQLKAMGVKRGVPDILICWDDRDYSPGILWLELKSTKGRVKPDQTAFFHRAEALGHYCYVCRSLADVAMALNTHRIQTRVAA